MLTHTSPSYQIDASDIPLLEYNNILVANLTWIHRGIDKDLATFDLVVRDLPQNWGFYVFDGLERCVDFVLNHRFNEDAVALMKQMGLIDSPETEKFYTNFKFSGDLYSLRDGTIFFPGEPIVRITAPLLEANLLTAFLLNIFNYPVRILSKTVRVKFACADTIFFAGSLARLPGFEQALFALKAANLLISPVGTPIFYRKYPEVTVPNKITANINHAVIKSFPSEREAFRYVLNVLLEKANFFFVMVDTYDFEHGLKIFIEEAKKIKLADQSKIMITLDSGDLRTQALYAREQLDKHSLNRVRIQAMGNLDEYKINELVKARTPVDCYIAATALINTIDHPALDAVYKMAELQHSDGTIEYKAKLTPGKQSYPGKKQVFRVYGTDGQMTEDIIGLEDEQLGEPLLQKIVAGGQQVIPHDDLNSTKVRLAAALSALPEKYKTITTPPTYPIRVSDRLQTLLEGVRRHHGAN